MGDGIEERFKANTRAFEGLLALIPATQYYPPEEIDQENGKKQTKEENKAAKKAKLEPGAYKRALDVHREREAKRKREFGQDGEVPEVEQKENVTAESEKPTKKQKLNNGIAANTNQKPQSESSVTQAEPDADELARRRASADKRKAKRERKAARKAEARQSKTTRKERKKALKQQIKEDNSAPVSEELGESKTKHKDKRGKKPKGEQKPATSTANESKLSLQNSTEMDIGVDEEEDDDSDASEAEDTNVLTESVLSTNRFEQLVTDILDDDAQWETSVTSTHDSPLFDNLAASSSVSSTSSTSPTAESDASEPSKPTDSKPTDSKPTDSKPTDSKPTDSKPTDSKPTDSKPTDSKPTDSKPTDSKPTDSNSSNSTTTKPPPLPRLDTTNSDALARLQVKLNAMRAARKADGPDGKPARSRQELIDSRRRKQEQRKAHKKELRAQARLQQDAEAEAARLRGGSGSPLWSPGVRSPREAGNHFSFGRVAFDDGAEVDSSGTGIKEAGKKKGASDPKTALLAIQNKESRLSGLDASKRASIAEKDAWLNAKKRIHGEKVRDDASLLKKTLKRKEKGKAKSEKEWNERTEGVQKGKEARQAKREENLLKRREEKGKGKRSTGRFGIKMSSGEKKPMKKRPGFEGTFRTGARRRP